MGVWKMKGGWVRVGARGEVDEKRISVERRKWMTGGVDKGGEVASKGGREKEREGVAE